MLPLISLRIQSPLLLHTKTTSFSSSTIDVDTNNTSSFHFRRSCRFCPPRCAVEKESEFEIDRNKAREALKKLDEQLQTLSQQETLPTKRVSSSYSEPNVDRDLITGMRTEDMPEISGSYLAYSAVALLILTIFNNIIFTVFIKPSVDGNDQVSKIERVPLSDPTEQQAPELADRS